MINWLKEKWRQYQDNAPVRHAKRLARMRQQNEILAAKADQAKAYAAIRAANNKHRPAPISSGFDFIVTQDAAPKAKRSKKRKAKRSRAVEAKPNKDLFAQASDNWGRI